MKPEHRSLNAQAKPPLDFRLGTFFLWLLVLVAPFLLAPVAKESFREPKLLAGEWLVLVLSQLTNCAASSQLIPAAGLFG